VNSSASHRFSTWSPGQSAPCALIARIICRQGQWHSSSLDGLLSSPRAGREHITVDATAFLIENETPPERAMATPSSPPVTTTPSGGIRGEGGERVWSPARRLRLDRRGVTDRRRNRRVCGKLASSRAFSRSYHSPLLTPLYHPAPRGPRIERILRRRGDPDPGGGFVSGGRGGRFQWRGDGDPYHVHVLLSR
jgi:hypothetical protein